MKLTPCRQDVHVECLRRCGKYLIARGLIDLIEHASRNDRDTYFDMRYLGCYTRTYAGDGPPKLTIDNWKGLAEPHRSAPPQEKPLRLLKYLVERSKHRGRRIKVSDGDGFTVDIPHTSEFEHYLELLVERSWIRPVAGWRESYTVTEKGWNASEGKGSSDLGAELRRVRESIGLAQNRLAKELGMSPSKLCKIERQREHPQDEDVQKIEAFIRDRDFPADQP